MSDPSARIFESVPNVSTADPHAVRELAATLSRPPEVRLIHATSDARHGRTVFTVLGERISTAMRTDMYRAILKKDLAFFDKEANNAGVLSGRLAKECSMVHSLITTATGALI